MILILFIIVIISTIIVIILIIIIIIIIILIIQAASQQMIPAEKQSHGFRITPEAFTLSFRLAFLRPLSRVGVRRTSWSLESEASAIGGFAGGRTHRYGESSAMATNQKMAQERFSCRRASAARDAVDVVWSPGR